MKHLAVLLALALSGPAAPAQTRELLVDCGVESLQTGSRGVYWNDVHLGNIASGLALHDTTGAASQIVLTFAPAMIYSVSAGVQVPPAGSPLQHLGWPASALRDSLYGGSTAFPILELVLSNLDSGSIYDLLLTGSFLGANDKRATRYTAEAHVKASAVLEAANNTTELVSLRGLSPDPSGRIRLTFRGDATNTNTSGFYYLNALGIQEYAPGTQPPLIAFANNQVDFARVGGTGPFAGSTSIYTNDGSAPALSLFAVDDATGTAPTWLSVPSAAVAGRAIGLTVDGDGLPPGSYSATLYADSPGYAQISSSIRLVTRSPGDYLNLLYYGNSFSLGNGSVGVFVQAMAEQAGFGSPKTVQRLVGGTKLAFHLNTPEQAVAITQGLPLGDEWDFVIMQGLGLEATASLGNPGQFIANAIGILSNVRAHSPNARAVLFQPWARAPGHAFYPVSFANPLEMHRQIETGYREAVVSFRAAFGPGSARRAAAGETVALRGFDPTLYKFDLTHPEPPMSVMAFGAVYSAIYGARVCDIDPDFSSPSKLGSLLGGFGFGPIEWGELAGTAERVAPPSMRLRPGSGEDFLLLTGPPGLTNGCPIKPVSAGQTVTFHVSSPAGTYDGLAATIFLDEVRDRVDTQVIHYNPMTAHVTAQTSALTRAGSSVTLTIPPGFAGKSYLVQGKVLGPSPKTGLPVTLTDGHLLFVSH